MRSWTNITSRIFSKGAVISFLAGVSLLILLLMIWKAYEQKRKVSSQLVVFEPSSYNFGTVLQSETIHYQFRLLNRSDRKMFLRGMRTSCSCTALGENLVGKIIGPNEAVVIPVTYSSGFNDGPVSSALMVVLEDKDTSFEVEAQMRGEVRSDFTVQPNFLDFGSLKPGNSATQTVFFRPNAVRELVVAEAFSSDKAFEISLHKGDTAQTLYTASIVFNAPRISHHETLDSIVEFTTSSKRVPLTKIQVRGRVDPDIEISPDTLVFSAGGASGDSRFTIRTIRPSRITRVSGNMSEGLKELPVIESKKNDPSEWKLTHTLQLPNAMLLGAQRVDFGLEVRNETDHIEAQSVSVNIKSLE